MIARLITCALEHCTMDRCENRANRFNQLATAVQQAWYFVAAASIAEGIDRDERGSNVHVAGLGFTKELVGACVCAYRETIAKSL